MPDLQQVAKSGASASPRKGRGRQGNGGAATPAADQDPSSAESDRSPPRGPAAPSGIAPKRA